jgi:hypothetical protein
MKKILDAVPHIMSVIMSAVFLDSLRFKFFNLPETQVIFGALNAWAGTLGAAGIFSQTGLLSQYVIGSIELLASVLLIAGIFPGFRHLQAGGALAAFLVMSGAITFHLFTPLGIDPNHDGGGLFVMACVNWFFSLVLLFIYRKREAMTLIKRVAAIASPT